MKERVCETAGSHGPTKNAPSLLDVTLCRLANMGYPNNSARFKEQEWKNKSVPAEYWGTFVGYCVPQLIAVCVLHTEIKILALFE